MKAKISLLTLTLFFSPSFVFAYIIDSSGGDCSSFGVWNDSTLTCSLTQNLTETVIVASDHITIDGAGYVISRSGGNSTEEQSGISAQNHTDITVRNMIFSGGWSGVFFNNVSSSVIENNQSQILQHAIYVGGTSQGVIIKNNTMRDSGIYLQDANEVIISENHIAIQRSNVGILLINIEETQQSEHIITNNIIESLDGTGQGISAEYF
jgi:nitrous oxidase accessory protein NosD